MAVGGKPVSVRLDFEALAALEEVAKQRRVTRSEAIRAALIEAAGRRRRRSALAAEARALAADEDDRAEMAEVAALMESLRAPR